MGGHLAFALGFPPPSCGNPVSPSFLDQRWLWSPFSLCHPLHLPISDAEKLSSCRRSQPQVQGIHGRSGFSDFSPGGDDAGALANPLYQLDLGKGGTKVGRGTRERQIGEKRSNSTGEENHFRGLGAGRGGSGSAGFCPESVWRGGINIAFAPFFLLQRGIWKGRGVQ